MEEEINVKDLIMALWRKKIIIVIVTLLFFVIGVIFYGKKEDTNNSKSIIVPENDNIKATYVQTKFMFGRGTYEEFNGVTKSYKLTIDAGVITNLNSFAKSSKFLEEILAEINSEEKVEDLKSNINILGNGTSDIITLLVSTEKEEDAIKITNKILENLKEKAYELYEIDNLILIDGPVELEDKVVKEFEDKFKNDTVIVEEGVDNIKEPETSPKKKIILITAIGFVLACGSIVVIEIFSSSVKSEEFLEKATNLKVLVKIPKTNLDITDKFELLRVKLNECKTILVTSSEDCDGKSFVAMNLSKAFARFGKKVLLTDASSLVNDKDLEKDSKELQAKNLTTILSKENTNNEIVKIDDSKIEARLKVLEDLYDIIIIDSNNVLDSANTLTISKFIKTTILVSSERKTKIQNIVKAKNNIEDVGGKVIGNILNKTAK